MKQMITLLMLVREENRAADFDEDGEDDGAITPAAVQQETVETTISSSKIRNVHPRKYGKLGTRIVFENGSALIVTNLYDDVVSAWKADVTAA
jgi:hypothetical protein